MRKIFLYGPPGSGKSTVGKILAQNLNANFFDIDEQIESETGKSISQIISERGEPAFRELESDLIRLVCENKLSEGYNTNPDVAALGGGALLRNENRACCESVGDVVFLETAFPVLFSRLIDDYKLRPLLGDDLEKNLARLLEQREEHYASFKFRVATNSNEIHRDDRLANSAIGTPEQITWEIQQTLGRYHVRGMGQGYDVIVEPGGLTQLGRMLSERGLRGPVAVVCDENVASFYSEAALIALTQAGFISNLLVIPAGEENKTLGTVAGLWREFLVTGLDRKSSVVALGGGVVGDLAGFAASTFMRGCSWIVVPTSLLSMVDASLGGKTGLDLPEGKNLVGSFHPPKLVIADPDVLVTLPDEELRSGMAEVVKHGIISDPGLFEFCANGFNAIKNDLARVARRAMGVKVRIIEQDPYESGLRAALNLGHTVGHGLEIASHFRLRHGEAVAIGMVAEARLAERLGITTNGNHIAWRIKAVLSEIGLPTEIPLDLAKPDIIQAMKMDKKKENNLVKFALPIDIGNVQVGVEIKDLEMVL